MLKARVAEKSQNNLCFSALAFQVAKIIGAYQISKSRGEEKKLCPLPLIAPKGGGQNLNCKFKTFGFWDIMDKYKIL